MVSDKEDLDRKREQLSSKYNAWRPQFAGVQSITACALRDRMDAVNSAEGMGGNSNTLILVDVRTEEEHMVRLDEDYVMTIHNCVLQHEHLS